MRYHTFCGVAVQLSVARTDSRSSEGREWRSEERRVASIFCSCKIYQFIRCDFIDNIIKISIDQRSLQTWLGNMSMRQKCEKVYCYREVYKLIKNKKV